MREYFNLMEYTEEFINKIIDYRMHMDKELNRYLSYEEIAERENCSAMKPDTLSALWMAV